ncbi:YdeI/OmpD-associated family protein [Salinarimonas sp. NSM]|uniref:YdeI/OmpD-associated family protein n=1 Tax=Salinarimonas sp. NSM TaxID=3458003 RepID=UPI0040365A86
MAEREGKRSGEHHERVEIPDREALAHWLAENHARRESVWVVLPRKSDGGAHVPWPEIVDEALCWGWIDSLPRELDETRTMLRLSPRKPGSAWSKVNREKVARLMAEGRITPPGLAVIEAAKAGGSFYRLAEIDGLEPPADLVEAFAADPRARATFDGFPRSSRRAILEWILQAKRPGTRAERVARTVACAARGLRANHPEARGVQA